jgi:hypothetical protein
MSLATEGRELAAQLHAKARAIRTALFTASIGRTDAERAGARVSARTLTTELINALEDTFGLGAGALAEPPPPQPPPPTDACTPENVAEAKRQWDLVAQLLGADGDDVDAVIAAAEQRKEDAERLDRLEAFVHEQGALVLHISAPLMRNAVGLLTLPGQRPLRAAIDASLR